MKIPVIAGMIERRILVNYTVDPDVMQTILPAPFKPKVFKSKAIAGICLIRLSQVRPKGLPTFIGVGSENAAHRIAVEWEENGKMKEGVYIPRRDTSSRFNTLVGGKIFPGKHHYAKFDVREDAENYYVAFKSSDETRISVNAKLTNALNDKSIFHNLSAASAFFKAGSMGYSPNGDCFEGLLLNTYKWKVKPLAIQNVQSSYFENERLFPIGSVRFDNALLMTNIEHEWSSLPNKFC
jgi:hypothetical protein